MKKRFIISAAILIFSLFSILILLQGQQATLKKELTPTWAALWEARGTNPVSDESVNKAFARDFPLAVEKEYPIGSSPEKIISDCKALGYKFISKEMLPSNLSFSKEYPCRSNSCSSAHSFGASGEYISVLWCDENGKITWLRGKGGTWID